MHILFLTDNFPPEVNAPATRTHEHAREWVKAGHKVTVITCTPNFPKGRVFDGYKNRLWQREHIDGIDVVRVWSFIATNEGFFLRTLDYVSYMAAAIVAAPFVARVDVVIATSPQFFTAVAGYLISQLKRAPFVFELRDLWPESIRAVGAMRSERLLSALERVELFLYHRASAIVSVTHAFRANIVSRGVDPEKVYVVTNGADMSRFKPTPRNEQLASSLGLDDCFVAGYVGTHGLAHALGTLLDAADLLRRNAHSRIRILLLGDGAEKEALKSRARNMGLDNVVFVDTVPKDEVARYWSLLDASIIHLRDTALFETVIPSKLFEAMAMGIPVLHGVRGESARIVEESRAGLLFEPENPSDLCDRLMALSGDEVLRSKLAGNGLVAAQCYDRSTLAAEMLDVIAHTVCKVNKGGIAAATIDAGRSE